MADQFSTCTASLSHWLERQQITSAGLSQLKAGHCALYRAAVTTIAAFKTTCGLEKVARAIKRNMATASDWITALSQSFKNSNFGGLTRRSYTCVL